MSKDTKWPARWISRLADSSQLSRDSDTSERAARFPAALLRELEDEIEQMSCEEARSAALAAILAATAILIADPSQRGNAPTPKTSVIGSQLR